MEQLMMQDSAGMDKEAGSMNPAEVYENALKRVKEEVKKGSKEKPLR
jgi:hypothetical protein